MLGYSFLGPNGPGSDASPGEQVAAGIACLLFPTLLFCLVLFTGLHNDGTTTLVLAATLTLLGFVIARWLSDRLSAALLTAFLGGVWNFVATGVALILAGLAGFYQTF